MKHLTSIELAELFLVMLYDITEPQRGQPFIPLESILSKLGTKDTVLGRNIAYFLRIKKQVDFKDSELPPLVMITEAGEAHVRTGGTTGIIGRYRESPESFLPNNLETNPM